MCIKQIHPSDIDRLLPKRQPDTHKGDYGRILLICGSVGYTGAAVLAAQGALRSGAGLVYLAVPETIYQIEAIKLTEPVLLPVSARKGMLSWRAYRAIQKMLPRMDAVLIGPGLGQSKGTLSVLLRLLKDYEGPVVVDADGINLLKSHMDVVRNRTGSTILTPHMGEFLRLEQVDVSEKIAAASKFAQKWNCILLLKGNITVITDGSSVYENHTGNPGMATGGSGDILAGIITNFLGQGLLPLEAAACGAYLHGLAGDICAAEIGEYGMLPSDLLPVLPKLLK